MTPALPRLAASAGLALVVLALLVPLYHLGFATSDTQLWHELLNIGHVPLFGVLSLVLLAISRNLLGPGLGPRPLHYFLALVAATAIGGASELMQFLGPRDADLWDFVRDVIGAASTLAVAATLDRRLAAARRPGGWWRPRLLRAAAALMVLGALVPLVLVARAYRQRTARLPALCRFDSPAELRFVKTHGAALRITPPPPGWTEPGHEHVGKLTFASPDYPRLVLDEPHPDWSGYALLRLDVFSELDRPVEVELKIVDATHDGRYRDRFNREISVRPGLNRIRIPLSEVREAPSGRAMDMRRIRSVSLFSTDPTEPFTLFLDDLVLER